MEQKEEAKLCYVLDTNVLIGHPDCLADETFAGSEIYIPEVVISELEKFKNEKTEKGYAARKIGRYLRDLGKLNPLLEPWINANGSKVEIFKLDDDGTPLMPGWDSHDPDQLIVKTAKHLLETKGKKVALVTMDTFLAVRARQCSSVLPIEPRWPEPKVYTGQRTVFCRGEVFEKIASHKVMDWKLEPNEIYLYDYEKQTSVPVMRLIANEFLVLQNEVDPKEVRLGRYNGRTIVALKHEHERPYGVEARSATQTFMQEALMTKKDEERLVILEGPAGTAKTFYSMAVGVEALNVKQLFRHFLMLRANVEADQTYGFLPGGPAEKFDGFMQPIYDNAEALLNIKDSQAKKDNQEFRPRTAVRQAVERWKIEGQPLNFMRGRNLDHYLILVDEAQNLTKEQIKMIVTRAGKGSVVVLAGDTQQIDNPKLNKYNNGLTHALNTMTGKDVCWIVRTSKEENVRSELSKIAAESM